MGFFCWQDETELSVSEREKGNSLALGFAERKSKMESRGGRISEEREEVVLRIVGDCLRPYWPLCQCNLFNESTQLPLEAPLGI